MHPLNDASEDFIVGQPSLFWFTNDKCSIHWTIIYLNWLNSCSSFSFKMSGKIKGEEDMLKYKKIIELCRQTTKWSLASFRIRLKKYTIVMKC